jgi:hypothetical protein
MGVSKATVSRVLRRAGLSKLSDLAPAEPVQRYEREAPANGRPYANCEERAALATRAAGRSRSGSVRIRGSLGRSGLELTHDRLDQLVRGPELDLPAGHQVFDATCKSARCRVGTQLQHVGKAIWILGFAVEGHR